MDPLSSFLGDSSGIRAAVEQVRRLLRRPAPGRRPPAMLIGGETGTGKGLLARAIHAASSRASHPFVPINCAAIPESLIEAELFGVEAGAFTGAIRARPGLFQAAHRGVLFLDEIGALGPPLQAKLLTAIEEGVVRRVGSVKMEAVNVWILAATSEDLLAAIAARRFRPDLYHRLATITFMLPPLRERGDDIQLLADRFLVQACTDYGLPAKTLAPDARCALASYPWPGNVRELANVMERAALMVSGGVLTATDLTLPAPPASGVVFQPGDGRVTEYRETVRRFEREQLLEALARTRWNVVRAAEVLGLPRTTLRRRMARLGLVATHEASRPAISPVEEPAATVSPREPDAPVEPRPTRWIRRRVTLLASGFAGSSPRAVDRLLEKVTALGGHIVEIGPERIVAAFGVEPSEDAPVRAVQAAMAIRRAVERSSENGLEASAVRTAVHVAVVLVGDVSRGQEVAIDADHPARVALDGLLQQSEGNAILASPEIVPYLKRHFLLEPVGAAARVIRPDVAALDFAGGRVKSFVGRERELASLRTLVDRAEAGQGQVVGVIGEPGVGKSRLLREFRWRLAGRGVRWVEGHAAPSRRETPYGPVLDLLRNACQIGEHDDAAGIAAKLRGTLLGFMADPAATEPYLGSLLDLRGGSLPGVTLSGELSPDAIRVRTFESLRQLWLRASLASPLMLVVEDQHWSDATSSAFLESLVDALPGARIVLCVTYRSGYRPPWMGRSHASQIAVPPLSPDESREILASLLSGQRVTEDVVETVLARAGGNPFFLEELARTFETRKSDGRPSATVPETVQHALLARMQVLPPVTRRALQTAAVLGREVPRGLLELVWPGGEPVDPHLGELVRREFLHENPRGSEGYRFTHALTQEVAYESLPLSERRALHLATGQAIERLHADDLGGVLADLAHHFSRAEDAAKAVEYLVRVADRATAAYALPEALATLARALEHAERLPPSEGREIQVLRVAARHGLPMILLGRPTELRDVLLRYRERVERLDRVDSSGPFHTWLAAAYAHAGDQDLAVPHAFRAIEDTTRADDHASRAWASAALGLAQFWLGQFRGSVGHTDDAIASLGAIPDSLAVGMLLYISEYGLVWLARFQHALDVAAEIARIGEVSADRRLQSYALSMRGWVASLQGRSTAAIADGERAAELSPDPMALAINLTFLGETYVAAGETDRARSGLDRAQDLLAGFHFVPMLCQVLCHLSEAERQVGRLDRARQLAHEALTLAPPEKFPPGRALGVRALGRVAHVGGALEEAARHLNDAAQLLTALEAPYELARTRLDQAEVAWAQGRREVAVQALADARRLFESLAVPHWVERTDRLVQARGMPSGATSG